MRTRRYPLAVPTILGTLLSTALAAKSDALASQFDLPAEPLADALRAVGSQTNTNIIFDPPLVDGRTVPSLKADLTAGEAVTRLLAGTGIKHEFLNQSTIVLAAAPSGNASAASGSEKNAGASGSSPGLRLAQAGPESPSGTAAAAAPDTGASLLLEEIIVTAEKRDERLRDVPVPVTVLNATNLVDLNKVRMEDYFTSIPGLTFAPSGARGTPQLAIRGIIGGTGLNPTVGILVDDMPYGASTALGGGYTAPDIDPSELQRIEVLRGPQGTLYGASSLGGQLKFVTVDPSMDGFSARTQAGFDTVQNGAEVGYTVRGAANIPLSDTLAVRASAFTRRDPGYIDNPVLGINGINEVTVNGGRLAGLWRPSDAFSIKLSALLQHTVADGAPYVDVLPGLGDLQQSQLLNTGQSGKKFQAYSATFSGKVGSFDWIAISSYSINELTDALDLTSSFSTFTAGKFGVTGTPELERNKTNKYTEEARISTSFGAHVDWLFGVFYTHEKSEIDENIQATDPATAALVGNWLFNNVPTTFQEYAAFTDFTLKITDQFDIQLGGRESHNKQSFTETQTGPYVSAFLGKTDPFVVPQVNSSDNSFTYLVTPRLKLLTDVLSSDLMLYARFASGYRPGGPNSAPPALGLPPTFRPDRTHDYEIGLKADTFDHKLWTELSVYHIDWSDIQLSLVDPVTFTGYYGNGSRAKSQGVELSNEWRPLSGLTVGFSAVWNKAVLTQALPVGGFGAAVGADGERLPYTARFTSNVTIEQEFPLIASARGFVGGNVGYVGERLSIFGTNLDPRRQDLPAFAQTDLHTGVRWETWTVNVFANNVANRRGVLSGGIGDFPAYQFDYIQPRTVGASFVKTF